MFKKKKVLDTISQLAGIADKYSFTNEERAEFNKGMADATVEYTKLTMSENTVRSKTRRIIAVMIMAIWSFLVLLCAICWKIDPLWADHVLKLIGLISGISLSVTAFFFGGYYLKGPIQAFTNRFKRKSKE